VKRFFLALALLAGSTSFAQEHTLKIATLAPEGSAWMTIFHSWAKNVEDHSAGKIRIKIYAGGVAGDERDAVRKMRLGQINAAAVTAIGLGLIQSEVRVLELPMLIRTYDELDYVRTKLDGEFRKKFEEKGYVLLSWGDVGPVHIYSNVPLKSKDDLQKTKVWAWVDDPLVRKLFEQLGVNGVPLGVPDVLPSLQTGLINACYGPPLAVLAFQWWTKVKFMTSMTINVAIGATVMVKKDFDKLSPDLQKLMLTEAKDLQDKLLKQIRDENAHSLSELKKNGVQEIETPKEMVTQFEEQSKAIRPKLEPAVYSHEFREKVEKLLADYRAGKH
jgi:TRAP-type C4-dicarboxylate transport system substrate-binding protein